MSIDALGQRWCGGPIRTPGRCGGQKSASPPDRWPASPCCANHHRLPLGAGPMWGQILWGVGTRGSPPWLVLFLMLSRWIALWPHCSREPLRRAGSRCRHFLDPRRRPSKPGPIIKVFGRVGGTPCISRLLRSMRLGGGAREFTSSILVPLMAMAIALSRSGREPCTLPPCATRSLRRLRCRGRR